MLIVLNPEPKLTDEEVRLITSPHLGAIPGTLAHGWALGCDNDHAGDNVDIVTDRELRGLRLALVRKGLRPRPDPAIAGRYIVVAMFAVAANPEDRTDGELGRLGVPVRLTRLVPPGFVYVVDVPALLDGEREPSLARMAARSGMVPGAIDVAPLGRARAELSFLGSLRYADLGLPIIRTIDAVKVVGA